MRAIGTSRVSAPFATRSAPYFVVDIAHFAGLVAGGAHPSPFPHAHVVTTTTHKTLRGPRGGMILTNDADLAKKINSAIFPGLQGGPLMHVIAAKAVALHEALTPEFKAYAHAVVANAKALAEPILAGGYKLVTGGTDNHLMLVDLTPKGLTGKAAEAALDRADITCNKNGIPFDPQKPMVTSGIRLGSPAATSRGFGTEEFADVGAHGCRGPGRLGGERRIGECGGRGEGARGRRRTHPAVPHLLRAPDDRMKGGLSDAMPLLRRPRYASEGLAADRRFLVDPPAAHLSRLRRQVHHLRARAAARTQVVKKNGRRAPFDRDKLVRSVQVALRKRSVEPERVERMINGVVRQLESQTDGDIPTDRIGELVMEGLKALDDVAYVRFASVYRNFARGAGLQRHRGRTRGRARARPGDGSSPPTPERARDMSESAAADPDEDLRWMEAALNLGSRSLGLTAPNPAVGAILVKDGAVVGRGATAPGGRPHAERIAIDACGRGGARRDALCDARALLAFRRLAALRRRHRRGGRRPRRLGDGGSQSAGRRTRGTRG